MNHGFHGWARIEKLATKSTKNKEEPWSRTSIKHRETSHLFLTTDEKLGGKFHPFPMLDYPIRANASIITGKGTMLILSRSIYRSFPV